jgi:Mn-dependent DtxR family transcriptional regulator
MLERQLNFVDRDPHGKPIPSIQDISGQPKNRNPDGMTGYHTPS